MNTSPTVTIYTDGACSGNPGPGGWGAVLIYNNHEKELCGGMLDTTNNQMELSAVTHALNALTKSCHIELYTDSKYVKDGVLEWMPNWKQRGWKTANKKPVKNKEFWIELDEALARHQVNWHWVKGHSGDHYNEKADALARKAIEEIR